jgi:hypothetical protein
MIGSSVKTFYDKTPKTAATDTHRTAKASERDFLAQQVRDKHASLVMNRTMGGTPFKLAPPCFTPLMPRTVRRVTTIL